MPSKKKSKPSFQVPEDLQSAPQAGWVYRSDQQAPAKGAKASAKPAAGGKTVAKIKSSQIAAPAAAPSTREKPHPDLSKSPAPVKSASSESSSGIVDLTARALSAGFSTAGGLILVTTTLLAAPFALGKRFLRL